MRFLAPRGYIAAISTALVALISAFANSVDPAQSIIPDEITVSNRSEENLGSKRVSDDDLIKTHYFKLDKGTWDLSYKPGNNSSVPFVWCKLRYSGPRTNDANRTYKEFVGKYKDAFNNLSITLGIFDDGSATVIVEDLDEQTDVCYILRLYGDEQRFMLSVHNHH